MAKETISAEKESTTTPKTKKERTKSDRSKWVPKGGDFMNDTIKSIKDFITKKC